MYVNDKKKKLKERKRKIIVVTGGTNAATHEGTLPIVTTFRSFFIYRISFSLFFSYRMFDLIRSRRSERSFTFK